MGRNAIIIFIHWNKMSSRHKKEKKLRLIRKRNVLVYTMKQITPEWNTEYSTEQCVAVLSRDIALQSMTLHLKCSKTVLRFRQFVSLVWYISYMLQLFFMVAKLLTKQYEKELLARNYHSLTIYLQSRNKTSDDIKQQAKLNLEMFF